ncbi:MAG TPA: hypothetical protein VKZ93_01205 [Arenibacter sp.]|nr:hypothetical protein [Arenibacter sp.]
MDIQLFLFFFAYRLPLTAYRLPLTAYRLPLTAYRLPLIGTGQKPKAKSQKPKEKREEKKEERVEKFKITPSGLLFQANHLPKGRNLNPALIKLWTLNLDPARIIPSGLLFQANHLPLAGEELESCTDQTLDLELGSCTHHPLRFAPSGKPPPLSKGRSLNPALIDL